MFLVGLPVVMGTLLVILLLLSIIAKWVLMFRYREGRHPLWGWQYLRWWTVSADSEFLFLDLPVCFRLSARASMHCSPEQQCFVFV